MSSAREGDMKPSSSWEVSIYLGKRLIGLSELNGIKRRKGCGLWFVNLGRSVLSNCRYSKLMLARKLRASLLFQQQRFTGLECERGNTRPSAGFEGLRAETGNVKPQVVLLFRDFDRHGAAGRPGQFAAASEAFIGAFKALDRQHSAIFDDHGLTDFEVGD